ncbi:MAG: hypothetical protein QG596_1795 [Actinomycetota bacterium]|jgi:hypothetical protein|nr:hypothetical protein [Actinomycetota bacterium]
MKGSFRGFSIDRDRAIRVGGLIGLAVLGISTLPDLLATPEPPPVPANVGFRPGEMARFAGQPGPDRTRSKAGAERKAERKQQSKLASARRERRRLAEKRKDRLEREQRRNKREKKRGKKRSRSGPTTGPAPDSSASSVTAPVPATPVTAGAATYSPPAPATPPAPAPAPPPRAGDGSEEFAPR